MISALSGENREAAGDQLQNRLRGGEKVTPLALAEALVKDHTLEEGELRELLSRRDPEVSAYLKDQARQTALSRYGNQVFVRGLIEFTNYCKNDCYYCGIRRGNRNAQRYRLDKEDILACCDLGHRLGFRTFVLQSGEDPWFTDERLAEIVREIKARHPDCAVTPLGRGTEPGELPALEGGRGGPVPAPPRDRLPRPLRQAPSPGADLCPPDGMPLRLEGTGVPGGGRVHGGVPLPDAGGPGQRSGVSQGVPAPHGGDRAFSQPAGHPLPGLPQRLRRTDPVSAVR